jgi:hypothetical protein
MVPERRRKRSSFAGLALHYWLSAVARRKHLWGLVLADSAGLLVAASIKGTEAEEVAALAPLLVQGRRPTTDMPDTPVVVHQLYLDQSLFYLCAVGDSTRSLEGARLAADGIKRILAIH